MEEIIHSIRTIIGMALYEYGTCFARPARKMKARRNRITGTVEFILYLKDRKKEHWEAYDKSWWKNFEPTENRSN